MPQKKQKPKFEKTVKEGKQEVQIEKREQPKRKTNVISFILFILKVKKGNKKIRKLTPDTKENSEKIKDWSDYVLDVALEYDFRLLSSFLACPIWNRPMLPMDKQDDKNAREWKKKNIKRIIQTDVKIKNKRKENRAKATKELQDKLKLIQQIINEMSITNIIEKMNIMAELMDKDMKELNKLLKAKRRNHD